MDTTTPQATIVTPQQGDLVGVTYPNAIAPGQDDSQIGRVVMVAPGSFMIEDPNVAGSFTDIEDGQQTDGHAVVVVLLGPSLLTQPTPRDGAPAPIAARVTVTYPGTQWSDSETVTGTVVFHHPDAIDIARDDDAQTFTLYDTDLAPGQATLEVHP